MIRLNKLNLHFGARNLLNDVSLVIKEGDKIGLVGRNGTGKSTLLKILSGEIRSYSGQVEIPSRYAIGYLAQSVTMEESLTPREVCYTAFRNVVNLETRIAEVQSLLESADDTETQIELSGELGNLYEQLQYNDASKIEEETARVLKGMGFSEKQIDEPVSKLSGGWKMRVELARLLLLKPELLLLDEPTNHLDIESILWFENHMRTFSGTVILVSHDEHVLDAVTNRTFEITTGSISDYPYPYSKAMVAKEEQMEKLLAAQDNQQRVIAHKERLINKFRAKSGKAKFAKALQSELDRMEIIEVESSAEKAMRLRFVEGPRVGREAYKLEDVSKSYGPKTVFRDLNLVIERGERLAFVGQNGQGKTTLARILAGDLEHSDGNVYYGHNLQLGYYAQDATDNLDNKKTILETLAHEAPAETEGKLRSMLGAVLFEGDDVTKKVSVLSGGERARLTFACMAAHPSNVLILDEPTNHLDIISKDILKAALNEFSGTLIVVSHDLAFLSGLTEHTLEFRDGGIKKHLYDIDEFLKLRRLDDLRELERDEKGNHEKASRPKAKHDRTEEARLRKRAQTLERQIEKLEAQKEKIGLEMGGAGFYEREDSASKVEEYRKILSSIDEKTAEWELLIEQMHE